eukprot:COSAG05_NODE_2301_length_3253_cov_2.449905_5_plen_44_part_01
MGGGVPIKPSYDVDTHKTVMGGVPDAAAEAAAAAAAAAAAEEEA